MNSVNVMLKGGLHPYTRSAPTSLASCALVYWGVMVVQRGTQGSQACIRA